MKELRVSDSSDFNEFLLIDSFYPSPNECQELNREIFNTIFSKDINFYTLEGLFDTTINRYFLTDIKLMEHPLIIKNIISHCVSNNIKKVHFLIHPSNAILAEFYTKAFNEHEIKSNISFHNSLTFWKNSLTKTNKVVVKKLKTAGAIAVQFAMLLFNRIFGKTPEFKNKPLLLWNSFANNREKIDYPFLDGMYDKGKLNVVHPNPYLFGKGNKWNKSIYRMGAYSISPWIFLKVCLGMIFFRKKFNKVIKAYKPQLKYIPEQWNADVLQKTFYFLVYNLLSGGLIENIVRDKKVKLINVFRGGAAAGLIYSGVCKRRYNSENVISMLAPHGTEFNPIDHFSYFFLDYNLLPSKKIKDNWDYILQKDYARELKHNMCKNVSAGRIDYAYLLAHVNDSLHKENNDDIIRIGIVLTYNSDSYQQQYILDIISAFAIAMPGCKFNFIVKPRPNLPFTPGGTLKNNPDLVIDKSDIFSFLNNIDIVIGAVSVYGVLTMVVTDAILCNIPALYFFPGKNIQIHDLGYSYHSSMNEYCFFNKEQLINVLSGNNNVAELAATIKRANALTKEMLVFEQNAFDYLEEFIENKS